MNTKQNEPNDGSETPPGPVIRNEKSDLEKSEEFNSLTPSAGEKTARPQCLLLEAYYHWLTSRL
jgi:hypothetical protein